MDRQTPMLSQYRAIKARFPDALVLFRLGDFYETFEADARIAARELELVLTSRSFAKGVRLPMAGVPHHHVQSYIARLIEKGYKVAVVEQLEDAKKVRRLVKRDVIRVITPGTVVEDALLRPKSDNYLVAIVRSVAQAGRRRKRALVRESANDASNANGLQEASSVSMVAQSGIRFGLSVVDLSTGDFATTEIEGTDAEAQLRDELQRLQASEYVLSETLAADADLVARLQEIRAARVSPLPDRDCAVEAAEGLLRDHFHTATLEPFGCADRPLALAAAGTLLAYLRRNQAGAEQTSALAHLSALATYSLADYMMLDAATRRNLELTAPLQGEPGVRNGHTRSLFGVLDETKTAMGARLLKRWIHQPLLDLDRIRARLDAVEALAEVEFLRQDLRKLLDGLYDVERLVGRIGFGNANARDLIGLKRALLRLPKIKQTLAQARAALLRDLNARLDPLEDVASLIDRALVDDPPILVREGGLIAPGYHTDLDALRESASESKQWLHALEEHEQARTGIKSLRVRYNEVFGFFIEVPRSLAGNVPKNYERRATISHAERFVIPELKTREAQILSAEDRVKDLEYELFVQVRRLVAAHAARLQTAARILAQLDVLACLAEIAKRYGYVKPLMEESDTIEIREGRHAVVERFMREGEAFVPNDCLLDGEAQRVLILTGPNMSGKSVFIRQVALIVLLAQMGSFVPAASARLGLTDRIFTRAGASDEIAQGRSTFLVEMSETSHILRHATLHSLVVLDEVGRGTSTYDGISLAWAIAEELHNRVGCKTLFATHYHELTQLESAENILAQGGAIRNYTMAVKEQGHSVVFLRQVIRGGAEKSFGIHVARLAGLPARVVERAEAVLSALESERARAAEGGRGASEEGGRPATAAHSQERAREQGEYALTQSERMLANEPRILFDSRVQAWQAALRQLAEIDIANLTPVQALVMLNDLQVRVRAAAE